MVHLKRWGSRYTYSFPMHNMRIRCCYSLNCCITFVSLFVQFNHRRVLQMFCRNKWQNPPHHSTECSMCKQIRATAWNFLVVEALKGNGKKRSIREGKERLAWVFCPGASEFLVTPLSIADNRWRTLNWPSTIARHIIVIINSPTACCIERAWTQAQTQFQTLTHHAQQLSITHNHYNYTL